MYNFRIDTFSPHSFFYIPMFIYVGLTHLQLLHTGHVVAEHAILQQGDGVTLAADLLDLLTCTVADGRENKSLIVIAVTLESNYFSV